jgi:Holliday junction resolvase RusA-like endonuclease
MTKPLTTARLVLDFVIPGSPGDGAVNRNQRIDRKRGRIYKAPAAKAFAKRAMVLARSEHGYQGWPTVRECSVTIRSYWPRRRHLAGCDELAMGDVDAPVKAVLDSLEAAGILEDDSLVREVRASKHLDKGNPRIEVEVWTLDGTAPPSEQATPGAEKGNG